MAYSPIPILTSLISLASLLRAQETVVYPPEGLTINAIDSINVVFETDFTAVNLTVFCLSDTTNDYAFHAYDGNPLPATGTAYLAPVDESIGLPWTSSSIFGCHMLFQDPYTTASLFNSGHFSMISTGGAAYTWSAAATTTSTSSSSSSTPTSTSTSSSSSSSSSAAATSQQTTSASAAATTSTSTPSAAGASASSSSTPAAVASTTSSGLSTGASAGIGVGVGLGVLLFAALGFWAYRRRKNVKHNSAEAPAAGAAGGYTDKQNYNKPTSAQYQQPGQQGGHHDISPAPAYQSGNQGQGYMGHQGQHQPIYESGGRPVASELAGHEGRYELGP